MIAAFDIGTTVLKGALFSEKGAFLKFSSRILVPSDAGEKGCYEADTDRWKSSFSEISAELLDSESRSDLRAVVISGNGPTLVPVGRDGSFLEPVMTWMDRRGTAQAEKIRELQDFYIDPTFYLPKALWIMDECPEVYEKTDFFLSCPESMAYWLTGEALTILPGLNFEKYFWRPELLNSLGIDKDKFPGFRKPGHIAGKITKTASAESGLPAGIPVVSAGPDFVVTLLGTAAVYPGRACDRSGTSEGINLCTDKYVEDPRLMGYGHVVEPWFNVSGIISTSGRALEWTRDRLGSPQQKFADFLKAAEDIKAGSDKLIFLPYLAGERAPHWDPAARGAFIGLGLNHGRGEMIKSVLESVGYAILDVIEVMSENGAEVDELRITGGPSKSPLWNQIKSDITGRKILVPESSESELLGNLVLALRALGETDDLAGAADRVVRIKTVYEPDIDATKIYREYFELYKESYKSLKQIFASLNRIS
jgi:xylulokinase